MTLKELSQLYWLNREIEIDYERLERLRASAYSPGAAKLDAMPHGSEVGRTTESKAVAIARIEQIITDKLARIDVERLRLEEYINTIDDSLTRELFHLRFVDGLSWEDTARTIGGGNTVEGIKKRVYRYMRKHP